MLPVSSCFLRPGTALQAVSGRFAVFTPFRVPKTASQKHIHPAVRVVDTDSNNAALEPPGVETLQRGCCVALRVRRSRQLPAPTVVRAFYDGKALGRRVEVCSIAENGMARRQRKNMLFRIIALAFFSSARYMHLSYFAASRFLKPGLPAEGGDVLARSFSQRRRL